MGALVTNNAVGQLASTINDSTTTITLASGQGALFPNPGVGEYFYITVVDSSNNKEIMLCTARATNTLTVERAQDGTSAQAFDAGSRVELRLVAALHNNYGQKDSENTWAEDQTFSKDVSVVEDLTVTGDATFNGALLKGARQVDALDDGTKMVFRQTAAPTGWTKDTTYTDAALRLTSGTISEQNTAGKKFSDYFAARTITTEMLPAHTHSFSGTTSSDTHNHTYSKSSGDARTGSGAFDAAREGQFTTTNTSSDTHNHTFSGTTGSTGSGSPFNFDVNFVDVIIATKDAA